MPVVALALVTAVASLGACAPGSGLRVPECTPAVLAYLWSPRIMLASVHKVLVDVDNQNCEPQIDIGNGRKAAVTGSENARGTCTDHLGQLPCMVARALRLLSTTGCCGSQSHPGTTTAPSCPVCMLCSPR